MRNNTVAEDLHCAVRTARLYCETGLGGSLQWVYGDPKDANMRLREDIRLCLGFLVTKTKKNKKKVEHHEGTAFFLSAPSETYPTEHYFYLVTAKHVLLDSEGKMLKNLFLRLNTTDGKRDDIALRGEWVTHRDENIDVAVMLIDPPSDDYFEWRYIHYEPAEQRDKFSKNGVADAKVIEEWDIGMSDELRVVGLFSERVGNKRNIPVVRSGLLSAMPEEPLELEIERYGKKVKVRFNAYLAEVRSIGGLSGSPVFVAVESYRKAIVTAKVGQTRPFILGSGYHIFLLGLIRGHWDSPKQKTSLVSLVDKDTEHVNMGMAYVTPIQDVLDVIHGDKLVAQRKRDDEETPRQPKAVATEDKAKKPVSAIDEKITREGFQDALKRTSRKTSPPESETNEK